MLRVPCLTLSPLAEHLIWPIEFPIRYPFPIPHSSMFLLSLFLDNSKVVVPESYSTVPSRWMANHPCISVPALMGSTRQCMMKGVPSFL